MLRAKGGANAKLDAMRAGIRNVSQYFTKRATAVIADTSMRLAAEGAAAGKAPSGRAWAPRKSDGGQALPGVGSLLTLNKSALNFRMSVRSVWALIHQVGGRRRGTAWKLPARRMLPRNRMPPKWAAQSTKALKTEFERMLKRAGP